MPINGAGKSLNILLLGENIEGCTAGNLFKMVNKTKYIKQNGNEHRQFYDGDGSYNNYKQVQRPCVGTTLKQVLR